MWLLICKYESFWQEVCVVSDTQVTVKACWTLVLSFNQHYGIIVANMFIEWNLFLRWVIWPIGLKLFSKPHILWHSFWFRFLEPLRITNVISLSSSQPEFERLTFYMLHAHLSLTTTKVFWLSFLQKEKMDVFVSLVGLLILFCKREG